MKITEQLTAIIYSLSTSIKFRRYVSLAIKDIIKFKTITENKSMESHAFCYKTE